MVEHWSEKPGVDSSILSLGISFFIFLRFPGLFARGFFMTLAAEEQNNTAIIRFFKTAPYCADELYTD